MKRLIICLSLITSLCQPASALEWLTDLPVALARAKKENKAVLLDFTGSDWCGWCMKLKREVFDTYDFALYANANLIMVELDFPRRKVLNIDQANANAALATKYGINGYPTIILINADGIQIGHSGYVPGGPSPFIASIDRFPGMPHHGGSGTPASTIAATNPQGSASPPQAQAVLLSITPAPAPRYGQLTLKAISGPANRRMVLINNETLMTGETAYVKTMNTAVEVTVQEIRADSVVILVKGQSQELKLGRR